MLQTSARAITGLASALLSRGRALRGRIRAFFRDTLPTPGTLKDMGLPGVDMALYIEKNLEEGLVALEEALEFYRKTKFENWPKVAHQVPDLMNPREHKGEYLGVDAGGTALEWKGTALPDETLGGLSDVVAYDDQEGGGSNAVHDLSRVIRWDSTRRVWRTFAEPDIKLGIGFQPDGIPALLEVSGDEFVLPTEVDSTYALVVPEGHEGGTLVLSANGATFDEAEIEMGLGEDQVRYILLFYSADLHHVFTLEKDVNP